MSEREYLIRKPLAGDIAFIYATWTHSYYRNSYLASACRSSVFYKEYSKVIDWILNQEDVALHIACHPDEENVIFGYMISQPQVIHYIYIKELFSRHGIAKDLIQSTGPYLTYTHQTRSALLALDHCNDPLIYNPFLLFKKGINNGSSS